MNEVVVPPAPHWYKSLLMACSPDNTLIYGSKNDLVIIKPKNSEEPAEVRVIHSAHMKYIVSVSLNRKWKNPNSYIVSLSEDSVIKVWDVETMEKKTSNRDHTEHKEPVIGAVFAGDDRIVSSSVHGIVYLWNLTTNESKPVKDLFKGKVTLTCLSSCPHAGWLLAFGTSNGCVIVADMRREGQVLYKLRGHYQSVVSLAWCPAPVNIFPKKVNNVVKNKCSEDTKSTEIKEDEGAKGDLLKSDIHAGGDGTQIEPKTEASVLSDFLKECDALKNKILGLETQITESEDKDKPTKEKVKPLYEIEEEPERHEIQNRPFPKIFDPSGDFLDDSGLEAEPNFDTDFGIESTKHEGEAKQEKKIEIKPKDVKETEQNKETEVTTNKAEQSEKLESECQEVKQTELASGVASNSEGTDLENTAKEESTPKEIIEEEPRTEFLLASSGKDRSVYIWRAGTDGRMQNTFLISKRGGRRDRQTGTWVSLCWISPDTILTSTASGEILAWPLPKPKEASKQSHLVHRQHFGLVFNIVTPPKYPTAYDWCEKYDLSMWTWGHDGLLINYDVTNSKVLFSFHTVTAMVTSCSSSPLDPNRLAIGFRDGDLRVWDLGVPHTNVVTMQKYHQKYTHKVSVIAWHPLKEMLIGFGTEEGRVGFIDISSKKTTLCANFFLNQIHKIEWGPIKGNTDNLGLYVVSEGKMAIYDTQKPSEDPIHLELPEKFYVYKCAWKPDFSLLLLNGKDGSLVVLKTDLTAITTVYANEKGLNGIVWHPDAFTNDVSVSPRCKWFAATITKGVLIFDCSSIETDDSFGNHVVAILEGHLKQPIAVAWCPLEGDKIVSTASDGLSHVWDVNKKSVIATFVDSFLSHNYAISWSPVDPDLIVMGDKFLQIWRISKNPPKTDEEFVAQRKRLLNKSPKSEDKGKNKIKVEVPKAKSSKNCIVPTYYVSNDENFTVQVTNMKKLMDDDGSVETDSLDPFQIFGNKEQVMNLLDANYLQQAREGRHKSSELIALWKGNIAEYIRNAINENRVTPSIIAIAPMVSPKLWQDACYLYAKKLSETPNSDPLETAMYFLTCHKVEDAINSLCENGMHKEALALAKQRLPEGSKIITDVAKSWAVLSANNGNFENAAYCYISIKDYDEAAKVLARRNCKEFLEFAMELAEKAGNSSLADSIRFKLNELQGDGTAASEEEILSKSDAILKKLKDGSDVEETSNEELSKNDIPQTEELEKEA